ncbi:MAG: hypothetical protein A2X94_16005 [Bdellovibrionales bacterium GWB1_55_8]|nr:MAG: hypothetical protein A2X94_16005 [Bdellovibrionales bacterium GWB1_55_8]
MDRALGPAVPLTPAAHLLSHSELVEPKTCSQSLNETIAALGWLGQLEKLATESILPLEQAPAETQPSAAMPQPGLETRAEIPEIATPRKFSTSRPEYTPALRDRQLIEALLRLERSSGLRPSPAPIRQESDKFAPTRAPEIRTTQKASNFRRTPGSSQPILRSTDDESS